MSICKIFSFQHHFEKQPSRAAHAKSSIFVFTVVYFSYKSVYIIYLAHNCHNALCNVSESFTQKLEILDEIW